MPNLAQYNDCCGCFACYNACPNECITMKADITGFLYPAIDEEKCIHCGACERVCPALKEKRNIKPDGSEKHIIVQNKDENVLMQSTSGGAFSAFAKAVIKDGGVVFGAIMDENYRVHHIAVEKEEDLKAFRSSKYVQSAIGETYKQARAFLTNGRIVLFSGTPCQIAGLVSFLGKDYPNLITVDVMCRAVPSPKVFQKYVELAKSRFNHIDKFVFRDKTLGYSYSTLAIYGERKGRQSVYRRGKESDEWLRLFFSGCCNRPSCNACRYQTGKRVSDITMWDCFRVYKEAPELDNNKGATNVIVWKEKPLLNQALVDLRVHEIKFNPEMSNLYRKVHEKQFKDNLNLYKDVDALDYKKFFQKYAPNSAKIEIKDGLRKISMKFGIHDSIRKFVHRIRDRKH